MSEAVSTSDVATLSHQSDWGLAKSLGKAFSLTMVWCHETNLSEASSGPAACKNSSYIAAWMVRYIQR